MILTFPYHDPDGKFNEPFQRRIGDLQTAFDEVCISVTPPTSKHNHTFLQHLETRGCTLFHNQPGSTLGDHFREALRLAVPHGQPIFYGFIDRILYAMDSEWVQGYLDDLELYKTRPFTIYDRSQLAWDTHPANYREIEHMVSRMGEWLFGEYIELGLCAFVLSAETADIVVRRSTCPAMEVLGEWVLLAIANDIPITTTKVDWLLWEDPYWEKLDPRELKQVREQSRQETVKRINVMTPFMLMLAEDRFRDLRPRIERI